jgi:hypothetical protein
VQLRTDPTVFTWRTKHGLEVVLGTHVDDLLIGATPAGLKHLQKLGESFVIKSWDKPPFDYCGRRIIRDSDGTIRVNMLAYTESLGEGVTLSKQRASEVQSPLTTEEHSQFRSIVGALAWLSTRGRPDLAFEVSRLQGQAHTPLVQDALDAKKLVKLAKAGKDLELVYKPFQISCIVSVSDSSFANMQQGRSQCGHFLLFGDKDLASGQTGTFSVAYWRSGRQRRVARSTFGAEMLGLADAVDGGDFLRGLLFELLTGEDPRQAENQGLPHHWCTDSRDLYDTLTKEGAVSTAEKRLMLDISVMRELLSRPLDEAHWISTTQMLSDPLTKGMNPEYLLARLGDHRWGWQEDPDVAKSAKKTAKKPLPQLSAASTSAPQKKERAV